MKKKLIISIILFISFILVCLFGYIYDETTIIRKTKDISEEDVKTFKDYTEVKENYNSILETYGIKDDLYLFELVQEDELKVDSISLYNIDTNIFINKTSDTSIIEKYLEKLRLIDMDEDISSNKQVFKYNYLVLLETDSGNISLYIYDNPKDDENYNISINNNNYKISESSFNSFKNLDRCIISVKRYGVK